MSLTLDKFGEKIGVQSSAISKLEKGRVKVSEQMSKAICREFNVNYNWLMNGQGEMFIELPQTILDELCSQYECDSLDKVLIECYLNLNADERRAIKNYAQNLISVIGKLEAGQREKLGVSGTLYEHKTKEA